VARVLSSTLKSDSAFVNSVVAESEVLDRVFWRGTSGSSSPGIAASIGEKSDPPRSGFLAGARVEPLSASSRMN